MNTDKHTIEMLVRAFFHSYFAKAAELQNTDISSAEPMMIKQLMIKHIDILSTEFNKNIARAFATVNNVDVPEKLLKPKTFEGATALIKYTLGGSKEMYNYMVERYKYHFTLALSGTIEKADSINDTLIMRAVENMK